MAIHAQAFRDALRREWYRAKLARAQAEAEAEAEASIELPADVVAACHALRLEASYEPHTFAGRARFHALHAYAVAIEAARRRL